MYRKCAICVFLACFICFFNISLAQDEVPIEDVEAGSGLPYAVGEGFLEVGTTYYADRDYTVIAMPEEGIENPQWIMTANNDKSSVGEDFLRFTVGKNAVVWVARDSRGDEAKGGVIPEWLSEDAGWERHEDMLIEVTDSNMGTFVLYSKEFEKGEVVLGGNADPPASGQGSNYLVLITPGAEMAVEPMSKLSTRWGSLKLSF